MLEKLEYYLKPKNWEPLPNHQYNSCELWFPLSSSVNDWKHDFHNLMLRDKIRMSAYISALDILVENLYKRIKTKILEKEKQHLKITQEDKTIRILDVGSGSGIWTYYVAEKWKEIVEKEYLDSIKIYSIEINELIYRDILVPKLSDYYQKTSVSSISHIFQDSLKNYKILSLNCSSNNLFSALREINSSYLAEFDPLLNDRLKKNHYNDVNIFDAIISECLGGLGDEEGYTEIIYPLINQFANDQCIVVPEAIEQYFVPVSCDIIFDSYKKYKKNKRNEINIISSLYNYDQKELNYFDVIIPDNYNIGSPKLLQRIIYKKGYSVPSNYKEDVNFEFADNDKGKYIVGIKGYFKTILININDKKVELDISGDKILPCSERNTSDCWKHTFLPLKEKWQVMENRLKFVFSRKLIDHTKFHYEWTLKDEKNAKIIDNNFFTTQYFGVKEKKYSFEKYKNKRNTLLNFYLLIEKLQLSMNNIFMGVIFTLALFPGNIYDNSKTEFPFSLEHGINITINWEIRIALLALGFFVLRTNLSLEILSKDYKFRQYISDTFIYSKNQFYIISLFMFSLLSLIIFIGIPLYIAISETNKIRAFFIGISALILLLTLYDYSSYEILKYNISKDEKNDWTNIILKKAFKVWLNSDYVIISILAIFFVYEILSSGDINNYLQNSLLVTSIFFIIFNAIDYLWLNRNFYLEKKKYAT